MEYANNTVFNGNQVDGRRRLVVIGGGFAGLNFVKDLKPNLFDVTIIDRNNYHSFPPLFYQVASAGLDPASICFPLRRELRRHGNGVRFVMGEVRRIDTVRQSVYIGTDAISYDLLVIAAGTTNNFFSMPQLKKTVYTLKTTGEALRCRNDILRRLEMASMVDDTLERRRMLNFVIIGGGPTGVEIAGALGEMKRFILPRDYPSIPQDDMGITIVEGNRQLLRAMGDGPARKAAEYLESLMVTPRLGVHVEKYEDGVITLADGSKLPASMVIWTAGIEGVGFEFLTARQGAMADCRPEFIGPGNRLTVDAYCRVSGVDNVYAIGDIAYMTSDPAYPAGHPQLAQVAIQQGRLLARNFSRCGKAWKPFRYKDKGSMATVGRNRAIVKMKYGHIYGLSAWLIWMFVHLISILGMRNRLTVLINWIWAYFTYSTSLRLLISPDGGPAELTSFASGTQSASDGSESSESSTQCGKARQGVGLFTAFSVDNRSRGF